MRIIATQMNVAEDCWMYRLEDNSTVKGATGAERIPCGLEYNERNQWGANQIFGRTNATSGE